MKRMPRFTLVLLSALSLSANPLLKFSTPIPWDQIQPEHIKSAIEQHIKDAEQRRIAYVASKAAPTWDNSIEAREQITDDLQQAWGLVTHLQSVNNTPALRKEFNATQPLVTRFASTLALDTGVYDKVKAYAATREAKSLTGPRKRMLEIILDGYRRSGVTLEPAKRARVLELRQQLAQLSTKFAQNALDSTNAFELIITDLNELKGLPADALQAAALSAKSKGKEGYRFTLQAPSILPVYQYAENAALREKISRASSTIASAAPYDNRPIIEQTTTLRREIASLLGYQNFADYQVELRMAKSGQGIKDFLTRLESQTRTAFEKESAQLLSYRRAIEGESAPALRAWDITFYTQKLRQKEFQFDQNELRPYFEINRVLTGLFGLVKQLYGIEVTELKNVPVWHSQVRAYRINDQNGTELATFYADFFPRESKRAGAWQNNFYIGFNNASSRSPHIGTIVSNITPPNAAGEALLTHNDVITIFHEFGHLLHLALREGSLKALNSTTVPWDFVELPSQIMENFTWEKPVLDSFAKHHATGAPLPDALFDKMIKSRTFMAATAQMRQLSLGTMDIQLHTDYKLNGDYGDPVTYARQIAQRFTAAPLEPEACPICAFSHVFAGGYAAGYYSYKWAEVLDADAFSKFKATGVINRKTGDQFRKAILAQGNAKPASILYRDFMGRDPDPAALLRRIGLATTAQK
jgi:oligopeptidase A